MGGVNQIDATALQLPFGNSIFVFDKMREIIEDLTFLLNDFGDNTGVISIFFIGVGLTTPLDIRQRGVQKVDCQL